MVHDTYFLHIITLFGFYNYLIGMSNVAFYYLQVEEHSILNPVVRLYIIEMISLSQVEWYTPTIPGLWRPQPAIENLRPTWKAP